MLRLARSSVRYQIRTPALLHACNRLDAVPHQHQQQRRGIITLCRDKVGKLKPKVAEVLRDFCRSAGLPPPDYSYELGESKKPIHTCFVKVPLSREMQMDTGYRHLMGRGRARNKKDARILAAMSADFTFQSMSLNGMSISDLAKKVAAKEAEARKKHDEDPLGIDTPSPDWNEMPVDRLFTTGRNNFIDFGLFDPKETEVYNGARTAILCSRNFPQLRLLKNMTSDGAKMQANLTIWPGKKAKRQVLISHGEVGDFDHHVILRNLYQNCLQFCHSHRLLPPLIDLSSSIGMAVLYPSLSEPQAVFLNKSILQLSAEILADKEKSEADAATAKESKRSPSQQSWSSNGRKRVQPSIRQTRAGKAFEESSTRRPLPIDSLKNEFLQMVNDDTVDVVILRGGTGSGKVNFHCSATSAGSFLILPLIIVCIDVACAGIHAAQYVGGPHRRLRAASCGGTDGGSAYGVGAGRTSRRQKLLGWLRDSVRSCATDARRVGARLDGALRHRRCVAALAFAEPRPIHAHHRR